MHAAPPPATHRNPETQASLFLLSILFYFTSRTPIKTFATITRLRVRGEGVPCFGVGKGEWEWLVVILKAQQLLCTTQQSLRLSTSTMKVHVVATVMVVVVAAAAFKHGKVTAVSQSLREGCSQSHLM